MEHPDFFLTHVYCSPEGMVTWKTYTPAGTALRTPYPHWHKIAYSTELCIARFQAFWSSARQTPDVLPPMGVPPPPGTAACGTTVMLQMGYIPPHDYIRQPDAL